MSILPIVNSTTLAEKLNELALANADGLLEYVLFNTVCYSRVELCV